jgi:hypothetical protein
MQSLVITHMPPPMAEQQYELPLQVFMPLQ